MLAVILFVDSFFYHLLFDPCNTTDTAALTTLHPPSKIGIFRKKRSVSMFEVVPIVLQVVSTAPFILSDAPPPDQMLQSSSQPNGTLRVKRIAKVAGAYA